MLRRRLHIQPQLQRLLFLPLVGVQAVQLAAVLVASVEARDELVVAQIRPTEEKTTDARNNARQAHREDCNQRREARAIFGLTAEEEGDGERREQQRVREHDEQLRVRVQRQARPDVEDAQDRRAREHIERELVGHRVGRRAGEDARERWVFDVQVEARGVGEAGEQEGGQEEAESQRHEPCLRGQVHSRGGAARAEGCELDVGGGGEPELEGGDEAELAAAAHETAVDEGSARGASAAVGLELECGAAFGHDGAAQLLIAELARVAITAGAPRVAAAAGDALLRGGLLGVLTEEVDLFDARDVAGRLLLDGQ